MKAVVLGYIRPELDYISRGKAFWQPRDGNSLNLALSFVEALIEDIETDKKVALRCLARPEYQKFKLDPSFDVVQSPKL